MLQVEHHQLNRRYGGLRVGEPERHQRLLASLAAHGQQNPVLVVNDVEPEQYVLIDGYLRTALLETLGVDLVTAVVLQVGEAEALILAHRLDARWTRTALEEGWLITELISRHGLTQQEVGERLSRSSSWVCRRLALVQQLSARAQDAVRGGTLPAQAAMKYLVPLSRANRSQCEQLLEALGHIPISVRQMETIYRGWRSAGETVRERIVDDPWLYLKTAAAAEPERVAEDDPVAPLLNDLDGICGLSQRARRRVREGLLAELDESRLRRVRRSLDEARQAFRTTRQLLEEECSTATPELRS